MAKLVRRKQIIENYLLNGIKCVTIIETLNQRVMHLLTDGTTIITDEVIEVLSKDVKVYKIQTQQEYKEFDEMIHKAGKDLAAFDLLAFLHGKN